MQYISTRGKAPALGFENTMLSGLARDGGLYVPETIPTLGTDEIRAMHGLSYEEVAFRVMRPFVGDAFTDEVFADLIAKAYANDWAAAITSEVWAGENESHLLNQADLIKTEGYEENLKLYVEEGRRWMRNKYGFNSRWSMQQYVKGFYDNFFKFHPEFDAFKI